MMNRENRMAQVIEELLNAARVYATVDAAYRKLDEKFEEINNIALDTEEFTPGSRAVADRWEEARQDRNQAREQKMQWGEKVLEAAVNYYEETL